MSTGGILDKQFNSFVPSPSRGLPFSARETQTVVSGSNSATGDYNSVRLNSTNDLNVVDRDKFLTQSGSTFIEGFRNLVAIDFSRDKGAEAVNDLIKDAGSVNGTITFIQSQGQLELSVPATTSSTCYYESNNKLSYEPGEMLKGGLTIEISQTLQNNEKIEWGFGEDNLDSPTGDVYNGIGYGYDVNGLYAFRKKAGTYQSKVYTSSFNVDQLDGSEGSRFVRSGVPESLDPLKNQIYIVGFEWYGIASPTYYVTSPEGKVIQCHIEQTINNQTGSTIPNPNLPIFVRVENDDTTARSIKVRTGSWQGGIHTSRSSISGLDRSNIFRNVAVNEYGALQSSNFLFEISRGFYKDLRFGDKFGRNSDVDIGSTPEDIWSGDGVYTGFNATGNENLETFSDSASDTGSLVSNGTVTSSSANTLSDSTATFVTDGVAVGDIVIDDTQGFHGLIKEVTSETTLTVHFWSDGDNKLNDIIISPGFFEPRKPSIGDSYRVATTSGTGAAVVKWTKILNADYIEQKDIYVIMNGTTGVISSANAFRLSTGLVVLAGSDTFNVGDITVRQAVSTSNVFAIINDEVNRTLIACDTVPANTSRTLFDIGGSISRSGGLSGSANLLLQTREPGGVFQTRVSQEIQTGLYYDDREKKIVLSEKTDIRWRVRLVSDNNNNITMFFKYIDYLNMD